MPPFAGDTGSSLRDYPKPWELYDLAHDRSELADVAARHPDVVADLAHDWQAWADRVGVIAWDVTLESMPRAASRRARRWAEMQSAPLHRTAEHQEENMYFVKTVTALAAALLMPLAASHAADKTFADVGKQEPITILTPSTPWLPAFTSLVGLYEEQTGNKVKLDVNPFGGVLEKARNDVRGGGGVYDVVLLDTQWTIEMYEGGFLVPFQEIDTAFAAPKELLTYDDSGYWNEQKRWRTSKGGKLMAFTVLGNVPVWYYRTDALKDAAIKPPTTVQDVLAIVCQAEQAAFDVWRRVAGRAWQRDSLRMDAMDGRTGRHRRQGSGERRLHGHCQQCAKQGGPRRFHRGREEMRSAEPGLARTGRRHPAARDRQGVAGATRAGRVGEFPGSEEIGGGRASSTSCRFRAPRMARTAR